MPFVSLSFKIHLPYRLRKTGGEASYRGHYFDDTAAKQAADHLAEECWLPANKILAAQIKKYAGRFKVAFSMSGTTIELLNKLRPDVIRSFRKLADSGCVEFFAETSHHSVSWLYSKNEFRNQVEQHHKLVRETFGIEPVIFRNTELLYSNELAVCIKEMGYKGIFCEGHERILQGRAVNQVYVAPGNDDFPVLLRNEQLSNDIAFRFDDPHWNEQPLTADKFASWIHSQEEGVSNVFLDYETFGVHKKPASGILAFLQHLPEAIIKDERSGFVTPGEATEKFYPAGLYDVPGTVSWKDTDKSCCVWNGNAMQHNALRKVYGLEAMVRQSGIPGAVESWQRLQSTDFFCNMCRNDPGEGGCRSSNPYMDASIAYQHYMEILTDFEIMLIRKGLTDIRTAYNKDNTALVHSTLF